MSDELKIKKIAPAIGASSAAASINIEVGRINYEKMFWLFIVGSVFGVLFEGIWCLITARHWETHTITIWGPYCIIYGIGMVAMYIIAVTLENQRRIFLFLAVALVADIVEYFSSWLIDRFLDLRAWDYSDKFLNIKGRISFNMTVAWGILGLLFARFAVPVIDKVFNLTHSKISLVLCVMMSVFMVVNFIATGVTMVRWSQRHRGIAPKSQIAEVIDKTYDDDFMQNRFVEWEFIR